MSSKALPNNAAYSYARTQYYDPLITVNHHFLQLQQLMKRMFDIVASSLGLIMLAPLFMVLAILVYSTSSGPILYKSLRIGKDKQAFHMYKFRTMVVDAHKLRDELYEQASLEGQLFKLRKDPRITPIGGFLRKYSLDEFPQLINVLKGEMSLVGPRPYIPEESEMFSYPYTMRFDILPGMTGPWQVSGRSNLAFDELCQLEYQYISNWSLAMDIELLTRTIPTVLLKKGAY